MTTEAMTTNGVRLLSHRPSVLYKVEHFATEAPEVRKLRKGTERCGSNRRVDPVASRAAVHRVRCEVSPPVSHIGFGRYVSQAHPSGLSFGLS